MRFRSLFGRYSVNNRFHSKFFQQDAGADDFCKSRTTCYGAEPGTYPTHKSAHFNTIAGTHLDYRRLSYGTLQRTLQSNVTQSTRAEVVSTLVSGESPADRKKKASNQRERVDHLSIKQH